MAIQGIWSLVRCVAKENATLGMVRREISRSSADMAAIAQQVLKSPPHEAIRNKLNKFSAVDVVKDGEKIGTQSKDSKELDSIMSTAQTQTRFLDSPGIVRNLQGSGLDFSTLKSENVTIYLVLPPERLLTHAKWLRLIISSAMTAMQRTLKSSTRPDVVFLLDEFPQLGRLQAIETAVSLNAGYGVKVWAAVQHLGQLKDHYGDNWETFLSAGCVTAFAPRDVFTRDHITKLIGTGSKTIRSTSYSAQGTSMTVSGVPAPPCLAAV